MKKKYIIIFFVIVIIFLAVALAGIFFNSKEKSIAYNFNKIINEKVKYLQQVDDEIYFYSADKKTFNKLIENDGKYLSSTIADNLDNIIKIRLSKNKDKILYQTNNNKFYILYLQNKQVELLPSYILNPIFFEDSKSSGLLYSHRSDKGTQNTINFYDLNSKKISVLIELFAEEGYPSEVSENNNKIIYDRFIKEKEEAMPSSSSEEDIDLEYSNLVIYSLTEKKDFLNSKNFSKASFFDNGEKVLLESMKSVFFVFDLKNRQFFSLNFASRFNKIGLSSNASLIYYGQIEKINRAYTVDSIWQRDMKNKKSVNIIPADESKPIDVQEIIVSTNGEKIYIINAYDQNLYLLKL